MNGKTELVAQPVEPFILNFLTSHLSTDKYQILPLAGDASARRYYRIVCDEDSWVLMQWEPFSADDKYPFLSVQRHFLKHGINVPDIKGMAPELGLVLLEDLGDLTLERKFWENQNQDMVIPFYRQAIDELLKIHYLATRDSAARCVAFGVAFDTEKLLWEMNYGRKHLLEGLGQIEFTDQDSRKLEETFVGICSTLDNEDKFICHRDYHSRNLMIKLGKMRVIDFQDARMGPIQYDLVSLVYDSYVDLNDETRNEILDYYRKCAATLYSHKTKDSDFQNVFNLQVIQRCFKACGSFSSFYNDRGDTRYLKYIRPTLETVVRHLELFPEYRFLAEILSDRGFLDKDYEAL
ncbi:MAG: phosphotransferase [Bdellovibrionaceae bacterium]|nr:phosphotransferase [Bdellovibrionales bacterium]MCB9086184.1 phosphotransferase [Pseudobdellovibrionaceae bacterium]